MSSSKILFYLCISFVLGIFFEFLAKIPQQGTLWVVWIFLFLAIALILISFTIRENPLLIRVNPSIAGFCILFFIIGILRFQISEFNVVNDKLSKLNGQENVVLTGTISDESDVRENSQKLNVKVGDSTILVATNKYPEYSYLDDIKLTGRLETPQVFEDFNYKDYLLKDHIYSVMNFPKIEKLGRRPASIFSYIYSGILRLKQEMRQSLQNSFAYPESSLAQGIVLGDKSAIPQEIKDKFKIAGLSHMIAVSGMHVAVLSAIIMYFFIAIGLWRQQAFWATAGFICLYVVLVGFPASAVRAGIMGAIYLSGQAFGRQAGGARLVVLVAALMLLQNPFLLSYDVGFQLSFLAVLGLIYLEPLLRYLAKFLANKLFSIKLEPKHEAAIAIFTITISAQVFTLPIIIYNFGTVSLVSPIVNVLVVPAIPFLMLFAFLSSLVGIFWAGVGWLISLPAYFLAGYVLWLTDVFNKPWAYKIISDVSWLWIPISYAAIGFGAWILNRRYRLEKGF